MQSNLKEEYNKIKYDLEDLILEYKKTLNYPEPKNLTPFLKFEKIKPNLNDLAFLSEEELVIIKQVDRIFAEQVMSSYELEEIEQVNLIFKKSKYKN